eukprot:COSAG02_NODE_10419_length_1945_cov_2.839112_2_plen_382_part_01
MSRASDVPLGAPLLGQQRTDLSAAVRDDRAAAAAAPTNNSPLPRQRHMQQLALAGGDDRPPCRSACCVATEHRCIFACWRPPSALALNTPNGQRTPFLKLVLFAGGLATLACVFAAVVIRFSLQVELCGNCYIGITSAGLPAMNMWFAICIAGAISFAAMTFVVEQFGNLLRPDGDLERLQRTQVQGPGEVTTPWWRYPLACLLLAVGFAVAVNMAWLAPLYTIGRQRCLEGEPPHEKYSCKLRGGVAADLRGCQTGDAWHNTWVLNRQTGNWTNHRFVNCHGVPPNNSASWPSDSLAICKGICQGNSTCNAIVVPACGVTQGGQVWLIAVGLALAMLGPLIVDFGVSLCIASGLATGAIGVVTVAAEKITPADEGWYSRVE